jgi:hypothetical protein
MHQPAVETMDEGISYGFGWRTNLVEGEPSIWHGGDTASSHSNLAFSPTRGWGVAVLVNVAGLPKNAALNEPVNEVMRLASGVSAGQIMTDFSVIFTVLWAIALLSAGLNLLIMWTFFRKYRKKAVQPKLVRSVILPIFLNFPLVYFMFYVFPRSQSSTAAVMFEFLPDTSLIFLVYAGIIFFTIIFRCVVYFRSLKNS